MSYQEALGKVSFDADASIALFTGINGAAGSASPNYGHLYSFVKLTGSHTVGLCTNVANERAVGVLQSKPQKTGTSCTVALLSKGGVSHVIAGGTIAANDPIRADASGHAVKAVSTELAYGRAVEAAASGAVCPVELESPFIVP